MNFERAFLAAVLLVSALWFFIISIIATVQFSHQNRIIAISDAPTSTLVIVLGASVQQDGTASDALRDRVETAIDLYQQGRVSTILLTGDNGENHGDEIRAMLDLLAEKNVDPQIVLVDPHGYRTYESCKNAAQIFHIQKALIVTQRFHLPRALYICERMGIDAYGIVADQQPYERIIPFVIRDLLASFKAWIDLFVSEPKAYVPEAKKYPIQN